MPGEFWTDAARMTISGLLVAAVAVPVGLLARARRTPGELLLPQWKPWRVPWTGFEVTVVFLVGSAVLPMLALQLLVEGGFYQQLYGAEFPQPKAPDVAPEVQKVASTLRVLWASFFALPVMLGLLWLSAKSLYPNWKPALVGRTNMAGGVWLAVLAWLVLAPTVLTFNAIVNAVAVAFDQPPEMHALTKLGGRPLMDRVLFAFEACVGAPVWEELFFRGVLLAWCVGRMPIHGAGVAPVTAARPAFVMLAAVVLAIVQCEGRVGPVIFAGVLAVGFALVWRFVRTGTRRTRAVYATAALFALGHPVWPNPIALFPLGLGLGWLAVRTNGILVPVLVHGLFNAISVVFVLRGV